MFLETSKGIIRLNQGYGWVILGCIKSWVRNVIVIISVMQCSRNKCESLCLALAVFAKSWEQKRTSNIHREWSRQRVKSGINVSPRRWRVLCQRFIKVQYVTIPKFG